MNTNEPRIAYYKIAPEGLKHLLALENYLRQCGLEKSLLGFEVRGDYSANRGLHEETRDQVKTEREFLYRAP